MCMEGKGLTKTRFFMDIVAIFGKILKSIGFNSLIFVIGFILGFGTLHLITHIAWIRNRNYECISDLETHLKEQRILDDKIDREIKELKLSILQQEKRQD